jgi:uncharacterized OB-fold protein
MSPPLHAALPKPTAASQPFWDACQREALVLPRCDNCQRLSYFPRIHCPHCGGRALTWQRLTGRARVFSFTHVAVAFHGADWTSQLPYTVVLVDLDEGPRMVTRLLGDDRELVQSGDAVQFVFPLIDGMRLPMVQLTANNNTAEGT